MLPAVEEARAEGENLIGEVCEAAVKAVDATIGLSKARAAVFVFDDSGDVTAYAVSDADVAALKSAIAKSPAAAVAAADIERLINEDPSGEYEAAPPREASK